MAHWDSEKQKIVYNPPKKSKMWKNWLEIDCGCCLGIEWGGEYPRECRECGGAGYKFLHIKTGVIAEYPGGPFLGRCSVSYLKKFLEEYQHGAKD